MMNAKITTAELLLAAWGTYPDFYMPRSSTRVVLCSGCWDIVHPGHLRHLRAAEAAGDVLIVSVTSDRFVNKGPGRPYFPAELRADQIAALEIVDHVVITDEPDAVALIRLLRPDVYAKGAEYRELGDLAMHEEAHAVVESGGRLLFTPGDVVFSSTELGRLA